MKEFSGHTRLQGDLVPFTFRYLVRDFEQDVRYDLESIAAFLDREGVLGRAPLGASAVRTVGARDADTSIEAGLKAETRLLLFPPSHEGET